MSLTLALFCARPGQRGPAGLSWVSPERRSSPALREQRGTGERPALGNTHLATAASAASNGFRSSGEGQGRRELCLEPGGPS